VKENLSGAAEGTKSGAQREASAQKSPAQDKFINASLPDFLIVVTGKRAVTFTINLVGRTHKFTKLVAQVSQT